MFKDQKGGILLIIVIVVLLLAVGGGAYYLGTQNTQLTAIPSPQVLQLASFEPITNNQLASIPSNWIYKESSVCGVSIPIPPKKEPYTTISYPDGGAADDNNRFWKFFENSTTQQFFFTDSSSVGFYPIEEREVGNGYVPGSVQIFCAANTDNLTTEQVITKLENDIGKNNYELKLMNKRKVTRWGLEAVAVNLQGGMFDETKDVYIFTKGNKMYFVNYGTQSQNQFVKDTTKQIFDNLQFP